MLYKYSRSRVPLRRGGVLAPVALLSCLFGTGAASAATYYVRTDGGNAEQCSGLADTPYPGSGSGQPCAWSHPFVALPPTNYGQSDPPNPPPRISGGDTLIVNAGSYKIGYDPATPDMRYCSAAFQSDCAMQALPSGPDADHPTRMIAQGDVKLWGSGGAYRMINLTGSSNVEVAGFELTDHSGCIVNHCQSGLNCQPEQIDKCVSGAPNWGNNGIWITDASNVVIRDMNIHGLAGEGIHGGRITDWTVKNVRVWANGFAGVDLDARNGNSSADTSMHGTLYFSNVEIAWNGCGERYPSGQIFGCWDQNEGGYGDGFGTGPTSGNWIFEDSHIHHNVSDGLDLLYANGTGSVTMRRVRAEGNAGNQLKIAGGGVIEDSVVIGSCALPWSTFPPNNYADEHGYHPSQFKGRYNMELSGTCRASGDAIAVSLAPGQTTTLRQNTITGQGNCLVTGFRGDAGSRMVLSNNVLYGGSNDWLTFATGGGVRRSCGFGYWQEDGAPIAQIQFDNNLFWDLRNGQCPAGSLCVNPQLNSQSLESFSPLPTPDSPVINASNSLESGDLDSRGVERPQLGGVDLGAVEYRGINSPDNIILSNGFDSGPAQQ